MAAMEMPKYFSLVRLIAQLGALVGCVLGVIAFFGSVPMFKLGFSFGLAAISGGLYMFFGSLAALGVVYGFLAVVQAQVETRNAVVAYIEKKNQAEKKAQAAAGGNAAPLNAAAVRPGAGRATPS